MPGTVHLAYDRLRVGDELIATDADQLFEGECWRACADPVRQ
jgi:hypothetical protein